MPRKKTEAAAITEVKKTPMSSEDFDIVAKVLNALTRPVYKIKLCCHRKDMPTVCGIYDLPFQPKNGDVICVKPDGDTNEGARITFLVRDLIYDAEEGHFVMRPDVIQHMHDSFRKSDEINTEIDPLGA